MGGPDHRHNLFSRGLPDIFRQEAVPFVNQGPLN